MYILMTKVVDFDYRLDIHVDQGFRYVLKAGSYNKSIDASQWGHWLHSTLLTHYNIYD